MPEKGLRESMSLRQGLRSIHCTALASLGMHEKKVEDLPQTKRHIRSSEWFRDLQTGFTLWKMEDVWEDNEMAKNMPHGEEESENGL